EQMLKNPNPNPLITGNNLLKLEVNHRHLAGNAIWWKNIVSGQPVELWPIKPDRIGPLIREDGTILAYKYKSEGSAKRIKIPPEEIIHFQFVNPSDFNWGMSPLKAASKVIDTDTAAVDHNKKILDNSAVSSGVLTYNHDLTREQWEAARKRVNEHMENPGMPWVIGNDANWDQLTFSIEELQLHELRNMSMYEIHAAFDVDPLLTGAPDTASRANKKEAKREFWQDNIIPYLESLKEGLENNLLIHWDSSYGEPGAEPSLKLIYDTSDVPALKEDKVQQSRVAERYWRMGVPFNQINDRFELGFDDVPGGNTPRGSAQLSQQLSNNNNYSQKSTKLNEREKTMLWKSKEEDRVAWEERLVSEIEDEFKNELEEIEEYFEDSEEIDFEDIAEILENREGEWEVLIENIFIPVIQHFGEIEIEDIEEQIGKSIGPSRKKQFDESEERIVNWMAEHAAEQAVLIQEHSKDVVRETITEARREGMTVDDIGKEIRDKYNIWTTEDEDREFYRAMRISRTETQMAQGKGSFEGAVQARDEFDIEIEKTWISSRDGRVRDSHDAIDGETRPIDEPYSNGLMHPGDPSGRAKEVIQCRCTEAHRPVN
ncbi:MAG: phage portal protein, partial [Bacillota bacterium]